MTTTQLDGWYGQFGGRYVPETLVSALDQLANAWEEATNDPEFQQELDGLLEHYVARPTPITFAPRLTEHVGGAEIWLKREDLAHTGAHKINNTIGQAL
ncbi:MAG: tryptophan synthase subunit beta, partial [Phycisphaerales bacterium]